MTTDGTGDEPINLEGWTKPLALRGDESDDEVARAWGGGTRAVGRKTTGKELMGKVTGMIAVGGR